MAWRQADLAAFNTLMNWRLQAVVPRPKDKADNVSTSSMALLLLCLSFLCLGPSSEYLSHTLCCVEVRFLPLLTLLHPKELGWEREAESSKKHRHRKFDSTTVQSVLQHLNHLQACAYVMDSTDLNLFWLDWFLLNFCWCSLDLTDGTEHCSQLLVWKNPRQGHGWEEGRETKACASESASLPSPHLSQ